MNKQVVILKAGKYANEHGRRTIAEEGDQLVTRDWYAAWLVEEGLARWVEESDQPEPEPVVEEEEEETDEWDDDMVAEIDIPEFDPSRITEAAYLSAVERGIDWTAIAPTGKSGKVTTGDVSAVR